MLTGSQLVFRRLNTYLRVPVSPASIPTSDPECMKRRVDSMAAAAASSGKSTPVKKPRKRDVPLGEGQEEGDAAAGATPTPSKKKLKALVMDTSFDMTEELQSKARRISAQLQRLFPDPPIPLDHASPFQLLTAVMLSAQSTDIKVNEVTPALFVRAPDAASMALLPVAEAQGFIRVLGLAPTKAKNLVAMSKMLVELHGGNVPDTFEQLESLPGIGHKTASVVLSQCFNKLAFPVDTHIHRLAQRWGLTDGRSVEQTEADLKALLPEAQWRDVHLQIIYFGRQHCPAQRHDPGECPICSWAAVSPFDVAGTSPARPGKKPSAPQPKRTTT